MTRLQELERRLRFDAAPFVFVQLADEYCRAGLHDDAIACCKSLLAQHPTYVTARVVLGRALAALGRCDAAASELEQVLAAAPDHLGAAKDLAQVYERLNRPADALRCHRLALSLAHDDQRVQAAIERLSVTTREIPFVHTVDSGHETLTDLDNVLERLGHPNQPVPPLIETLLTEPARLLAQPASQAPASGAAESAEPRTAHPDPLAAIEHALRSQIPCSPVNRPERVGPPDVHVPRSERVVLSHLERWLAVLKRERAGV